MENKGKGGSECAGRRGKGGAVERKGEGSKSGQRAERRPVGREERGE